VRVDLPPLVAEQESPKMSGKPIVKITLTPEQKEQVQQATDKTVPVMQSLLFGLRVADNRAVAL
jgi:hypothetical protein